MKPIKKNNQGSGLVTVIIATAFIAILGSIVMTATLTNYRMKQNNLKTKDSFYTAEQALDEVRIGLQGLVSDAISTAYLEVLENYSAYDLTTKTELMESKYFETIWNALAINPADPKKYKITELNGFLVETGWKDGSDITQGYGAILRTIEGKEPELIAYAEEGVVIKNLELYYRDKDGFVSIIQTDIRMAIPELQFAANTALPDITLYSTVADNGLELATRGRHVIEGSIYADSITANGITDKTMLNVDFKGKGKVISKGDFIAEKVTVTTETDIELWVKDMLLTNGDLTLLGAMNVADDLNIKGTGNEVTIKGSYNGYGSSMTDAEKSSAILINGNNTVLNLKDSKMITIAGHAYIGTGKENQGETGVPGELEKRHNIVTGESIAVKGNQLLYLIPGECIGVKKNEVTGLRGTSLYGKNPLTKTQYEEFYGKSNYIEIDDQVMVDKLGKNLAEYIAFSGGKPKPEKIFVQTNGETLVYYYMSFINEDKANQFFVDYYGINKAQMDTYVDFYTNGITMADPRTMLRLQLAGNVMKFDQTVASGEVQTNTVNNASVRLASTTQTSQKIFDSLCTRLVTNVGELDDIKDGDLTKQIVFENIVNVPDLISFVGTHGSGGFGKSYIFENEGTKAVITDNPNVGNAYIYDHSVDRKDVHLIIATGDVKVTADFTGLIIANGKVTIDEGVSLKADKELARKALRANTTIDGTVYNMVGFLWDGKEMLNAVGDTQNGAESNIRISDLVIYENWSKN